MYPCPCCENLTLTEPSPGSFEICPVCNWEDDDAQFRDPNYVGGANAVSLADARRNYADFGASLREFVGRVRKPRPEESPIE